MGPRYNYGLPSHEDEQLSKEQRQEPSSRSWLKSESYRHATSFQAGSTSPVSSIISADLGAFLSPVPGHESQGFRASTPRIHYRQTNSVSSQSFIEETSSIPSPEQSYAAWVVKEDALFKPSAKDNHPEELSERPRSETSSWSFADAASINHPSVRGLSNSRPASRYFSSESEQEEVTDEVESKEDGEDNVIPESLLETHRYHRPDDSNGHSDQSHTNRHFLSSSFEHPDTQMWQKRGSASTSLLSQRLERYRKDSVLNRTPEHRYNDTPNNPEALSRMGSLDRHRHIESRQSNQSRTQLSEVWKPTTSRSQQSDIDDKNGAQANSVRSHLRRRQQDNDDQSEVHHPSSQMNSRPGSSRNAVNHNDFKGSQISSQPRERVQPRSKYLQSSDFSPSFHEYDAPDESSAPGDSSQAKQTQVKAIGKTLAKLEKLLDEENSAVEEVETRKRLGRFSSARVMLDTVGKSHLFERIWQLQMAMDSKETELLNARRHSHWLEDQLQSARWRIDKLEHDADARHGLQERLHTTETTASEANQRVSELLQINLKLVQDHELLMQQLTHAGGLLMGRETPYINNKLGKINKGPISLTSMSQLTNARMAELQNRLRKLGQDSKQLEEYVKDRSSSRLSVNSPVVMDGRPRNPSPRLITQRDQDESYDSDESVSENLVDLLKLLKDESELHRHQLVKTVRLLAANVSGDSAAADATRDHSSVRLSQGLTALTKKIQTMERRYEEREQQLNRIIGINKQKNKQAFLQWKKRWEDQIDEWPAAVEPLLTQLESQDDDEEVNNNEDDLADHPVSLQEHEA